MFGITKFCCYCEKYSELKISFPFFHNYLVFFKIVQDFYKHNGILKNAPGSKNILFLVKFHNSKYNSCIKDTHFWKMLWIFNTCSHSKKMFTNWNNVHVFLKEIGVFKICLCMLKDVPVSNFVRIFMKLQIIFFTKKLFMILKMVHVSGNITNFTP